MRLINPLIQGPVSFLNTDISGCGHVNPLTICSHTRQTVLEPDICYLTIPHTRLFQNQLVARFFSSPAAEGNTSTRPTGTFVGTKQPPTPANVDASTPKCPVGYPGVPTWPSPAIHVSNWRPFWLTGTFSLPVRPVGLMPMTAVTKVEGDSAQTTSGPGSSFSNPSIESEYVKVSKEWPNHLLIFSFLPTLTILS